MRTRARTIRGITTACAICAVTAAVALAGAEAWATPATKSRGGTSFVAATAAGGVDIVLSRDGRQIRTALFAYKQSCSDGDTTYDYSLYEGIPVGANRKFSYHYESAPQASKTIPGATFSYTEAFSGSLNKAGTKIVGTGRATVAFTNPAGGSYTCDTGVVKFKAVD